MTNEQIREMLEAATPGPWRDGQEGNIRVYGPDGMAEHSGLIANVFKGRANARLIAAAPDLAAEVLRLREALREIIEHTRNSGIEVGTVGERVAERCEETALAALGDKWASHE
jgi:hypothetical protein